MGKISKSKKSQKDGILIENTVVIDEGCEIFEGVILRGSTHIGAGSVILPGSVITDSIIGKNSIVKTSYIEKSEIGENNTIGPFTNLLPGVITKNNVKIGSNCDIGKTLIGENTRVGSGCCIVDAIIEKESLVNSGVCVSNFNGKVSQKTKIGEHCFIGCNSTINAPVLINKNSYILPQTYIKDDVCENSFALSKYSTKAMPIRDKIYWKNKSHQKDEIK